MLDETSQNGNHLLEKEQAVNQQMALLCLRSFARATHAITDSSMYLNEMKEICKMLSKKTFLKSCLESESGDESVIAAVLLCLTEMFSCIGKPFQLN